MSRILDRYRRSLFLAEDEVPADLDVLWVDSVHAWQNSTTTGSGKGTEKADEVSLSGAKGSNVIPLVVSVGTWEALATGDWGLRALWEDLLNTVGIIWVDNGRDIEEGSTGETLEADLAQHAWGVISALGNRVPVANPAIRDGGSAVLVALDGEVIDSSKTRLSGELDSSGGRVLVDKGDRVSGGSKRGEGHGGTGDSGEGNHFDWINGIEE